MDQNLESGDGVRTGVATYIVDAVVAAILLALGLTVMITSWRLGAGWTPTGPGSGYFPFGMGTLMALSGAVTLFQALFGKNKNMEVFADKEQIVRVLQVFIPAVIYVGGIEIIGVYVASAIFVALFMIFLGKYSAIKAIIIAVAVNAVFFLMFEVWFQVPLYKGLVDPLAFLGY
ncbi:MAG TPA: tripartite tricarboxylate transporter TctB family protein [Oxalicibacterium sp.]|jgi:hypothetical protein|nr:tripartite tricarboxylate transporter TctB family protein [Oxalicibacterium sp.]